jgi:hypothetical protein
MINVFKKKFVFPILFLFILVLTSCLAYEQTPPGVIIPTQTSTVALPTITTTLPKTLSATITPRPATPTETSTPPNVPTFTLVPVTITSKLHPSPSPTTTVTKRELTPDGAWETYESPNGVWTAKIFPHDGDTTFETRISNSTKSVKWVVRLTSDEITKISSSTKGILRPRHWSNDGKYVYLAVSSWGDGPVFFCEGIQLRKFELLTGKFIDFHTEIQGCFDYSFSPDDGQLAYIVQFQKPLVLHILNIQTENEQQITISEKYDQAGCLIWSPDQNQLIFTKGTADPKLQFSVAKINLRNSSQVEILPDTRQLPGISEEIALIEAVEWNKEDTVIFVDRVNEQLSWLLDLKTNQIFPNQLPSE